jgi:hypothetical protein
MSGSCGIHVKGMILIAYKFFAGKDERKRQVAKLICRFEDDIKIYIGEIIFLTQNGLCRLT